MEIQGKQLFTCPVCNLEFSSDDGLCGHMKLHPEMHSNSIVLAWRKTGRRSFTAGKTSALVPVPGRPVPIPGLLVEGESSSTGNVPLKKGRVLNSNPPADVMPKLEFRPRPENENPMLEKSGGVPIINGPPAGSIVFDQDRIITTNPCGNNNVVRNMYNNGPPHVHRCSNCYKVFPNGRALGGHRRHCRRPKSPDGGDQGNGPKAVRPTMIFGFDLNKLP